MLVLAARRQALMKDRNRSYPTHDSTSSASAITFETVQSIGDKSTPRRECENNCTSNFTARGSAGCMRKCAILFKVEGNATETNRRNIEALNSRIRVGEKDFNTIAEELLETDESQSNGLYHVHPRSRYAPNVPETKDSANSTNSNRNNFKQSNVIENEVRQTSTEKAKFVRTTSDGRHKRIDPTLNKHRTLSTSTDSLSASDESDLLPYSIFGQKIATSKQNESKNLVTTSPRRSSIIDSSSRPTSKLSDEEVMEFSVSKIPSYERNKYRRFNPTHRNIVAMTRKMQNAQHSSDAGNGSTTVLRSRIPEGLVVSNNSVDPKSEGSTVVENVSLLNYTEEVRRNETVSSTVDPTTQTSTTTTTTTTTTSTTTTTIPPTTSTTTTTPTPSTSTQRTTPASTPTTESIRNVRSSTEISIVETTDEPMKPTDPMLIYVPDPEPTSTSTTERTTSTRSTPQYKTPTTFEKTLPTTPTTPFNLPDSMIKPRINVHREETPNLIVFFKPNTTSSESKTESPAQSEDRDVSSSTTKSFTRTTVSSSVRSTINPIAKNHFDDSSSNSSNVFTTESTSFNNVNMSMIYHQNLSDIFKPTKKSTSATDGVFLTNNNEVKIEMHRMNMATYVLAALGMFPILLIVLYIAKTIIFRRDDKSNCDLERYIISDSQKQISPVVKLDRADHQIYSDESIMTEQSFNRNFLKFKNLLGEGNFGQVWKAEADDLAGYLGTTRIVAVKTERCVNGGLKEEAAIMRKLGSHSNVVTLLGACVEKGN